MAKFEGKKNEFKRRLRMAIENAREARERGDRFDNVWLLNYAGYIHGKLAEIRAREMAA